MSEKIEVYQQCKLLPKTVFINGEKKQVYGLQSLRVRPREKGMGRAMLRGIESVAEKDGKFCLVAFCADEVLEFYTRCGWHANGLYEGKYHILTSIEVESIKVEERW